MTTLNQASLYADVEKMIAASANPKATAVRPSCLPPVATATGLTKGFIALKNGAELEGKDGGGAEASADYPSMFNGSLVVQVAGCAVIFADNYCEFTTGIAENRSCINALHTFEQERAASAGSIGEGLMLGETIRVPRHV